MAAVIKSVSFDAAGWGGPNTWFNQVPEPKAAKNRVHFDLRAPGAVQDEVPRPGGHRGSRR